MGVGVSKQLKIAIGLALAGILAGLWGFPTGYEGVANAGLAAYLLGLGMYLGEVITTWQDEGNDD